MQTIPGTLSTHLLKHKQDGGGDTQPEPHRGNCEAKIKSKPVTTPTHDAAPLWVSQSMNKKASTAFGEIVKGSA